MKITKKQKRVIIVLMVINVFALFVNYFQLSPKIRFNEYKSEKYTYQYYDIYLLTDAKATNILNSTTNWTWENGDSAMYEARHPKNFWPFVMFYQKAESSDSKVQFRFRGIFPDFDHTEFIVYTLLIFVVLFIKKVW